MSWLYIDTHEAGQLRYAMLELKKKARLRILKGRGIALLPAIAKYDLKRIQGIFCVSGPGSFSAIRTGVLDANLLARTLRVPLVELKREGEGEPVIKAQQQLDTGAMTMVDYIAPVYDAEPNITVKT